MNTIHCPSVSASHTCMYIFTMFKQVAECRNQFHSIALYSELCSVLCVMLRGDLQCFSHTFTSSNVLQSTMNVLKWTRLYSFSWYVIHVQAVLDMLFYVGPVTSIVESKGFLFLSLTHSITENGILHQLVTLKSFNVELVKELILEEVGKYVCWFPFWWQKLLQTR